MKNILTVSALAVVFMLAASGPVQAQGGGNGHTHSNNCGHGDSGHGGNNGNHNGNNGNDVVHHDSSLTGTGRQNAPLGVANGAITTARLANSSVTAGKLKTTNSPQAGQVLGFDGSAMQWITPAAGGGSGGRGPAPLRVIDSLGNEVGIPIEPGFVPTPQIARYFAADQTFVSFAAGPDGVVDNPPFAYYESADCTGPSYMLGVAPTFTQFGVRIGSLFHYPTGTNAPRHIFSQQIGGGPCEMTDFFGEFSQMTTVPLADLGTPPFRLAR